MIAAAITRMLKLVLVKRTIDGGVWVADTSAPVLQVNTFPQTPSDKGTPFFRCRVPRMVYLFGSRFFVEEQSLSGDGEYRLLAYVRLAKLSSRMQAAATLTAASGPCGNGPSSMAKELFGTDGIRGIPGTAPLDAPTLSATGRSLGHYLKREHGSAHVLIGMDTRESGPHLGSVLAAGLRQAGASVAFAGVITTPGVACLVRQNDFQAGVVISASHNPFQDNGVKLFSHTGMKFPDAVEEQLEADIFTHRGEPAPENPPRLTADESLDADADRALFVRERGKVVNGDGVLLAAERFLKSKNKLTDQHGVATSLST